MIWVCIVYIKYAIRRDRVLKKIEEIQKGPSETLALLGLTMMVPIAPGNFSTGISKISKFSQFRYKLFFQGHDKAEKKRTKERSNKKDEEITEENIEEILLNYV